MNKAFIIVIFLKLNKKETNKKLKRCIYNNMK